MRRRSALTLIALGLIGACCGAGTWSAYRAGAGSHGNTIASGTVALTDNDSGTAMLSLTSAMAGANDTSCINVSSTGSLTSVVRLHGTTTGTGLDTYLRLVVSRGTFAGAASFDSCANFNAEVVDYYGLGRGVLYDGTLEDFPDTDATGILDPATSWVTGDSHGYKFEISFDGNPKAEAMTAAQTFTWQARNI